MNRSSLANISADTLSPTTQTAMSAPGNLFAHWEELEFRITVPDSEKYQAHKKILPQSQLIKNSSPVVPELSSPTHHPGNIVAESAYSQTTRDAQWYPLRGSIDGGDEQNREKTSWGEGTLKDLHQPQTEDGPCEEEEISGEHHYFKWRTSLSPSILGYLCCISLAIIFAALWWRSDSSVEHTLPTDKRYPRVNFSHSTTPTSAHSSHSSATMISSMEKSSVKQPDIVVSVVGRVAHPGLYHVPLGTRVAEVLHQAGPILAHGNIQGINFAERVDDGSQIVITAIPGRSSVEHAGASPHKLNINTASVSALSQVKGIGNHLATKIVHYREKNGPFQSISDLLQVPGIKAAKLAKIRDGLVCV